MVTKPGEEKYLYIDIMGLTQGFTDNMSVLGIEIMTKMLDTAKGDILPVGIGGGVVALHGRQYMHISNLLKGYGLKTGNKMFASYDGTTRRIFESIDFEKEYMPAKKTDEMKKIMVGGIKFAFKIGPSAMKSMVLDHHKVRDEYVQISKRAFENMNEKISIEKSFDESIDDVMGVFESLIRASGILLAGMSSLDKLKKSSREKI